MDSGAWQVIIRGVAKSQTWLSDWKTTTTCNSGLADSKSGWQTYSLETQAGVDDVVEFLLYTQQFVVVMTFDLHISHEKFPHLQVRKLSPRRTKWLNHSPGGTLRHNSGFKARTLSLMLQGPPGSLVKLCLCIPTSNAWLLRWDRRDDPFKNSLITSWWVGKRWESLILAWVIQSNPFHLIWLCSSVSDQLLWCLTSNLH